MSQPSQNMSLSFQEATKGGGDVVITVKDVTVVLKASQY